MHYCDEISRGRFGLDSVCYNDTSFATMASVTMVSKFLEFLDWLGYWIIERRFISPTAIYGRQRELSDSVVFKPLQVFL